MVAPMTDTSPLPRSARVRIVAKAVVSTGSAQIAKAVAGAMRGFRELGGFRHITAQARAKPKAAHRRL
jgi:hypothetical protein